MNKMFVTNSRKRNFWLHQNVSFAINKTHFMKATKLLVIVMLAVFSYSAVSAQVHHRPRHSRHWHRKKHWHK